MRFPLPLQAANSCTAMSSSSRFKKVPARNQWQRGYCDLAPPPPDAAAVAQEGVAGSSFVSGDSPIGTVREANENLRRWRSGASGSWRPRGAGAQSHGQWQPPSYGRHHPSHHQPAFPSVPDYGPPHPSCSPSQIIKTPAPFYGTARAQSHGQWQPPSDGRHHPSHHQPAFPSVPYYGPPHPSCSPSQIIRTPAPFYGHPPPSHNPPSTPFGPQSSFNTSPVAYPTQAHQPGPPYRPVDYRTWSFCSSQPPPECERFVVLSYNILADYLARDHRSKLYFHIPQYILDWEWRKRRLLIEFRLWTPDIMCLQEVDRFHDLEEQLSTQGYTGVWKMRTGNAVDGCAIFWRTNRFVLKYEESIEFNKLGLRDNVAQICVLESRIISHADNETASFSKSSEQSSGASLIVVCNIHVLYNPKRGEIKLGQVRTLLHRAHAISKNWNDAPVVVCGDFNSTPESPLYDFIAEQKLNLSGLAKDQISGQYSAHISSSRLYTGPAPLTRAQPFMSVGTEGNCEPQTKAENDLTESLPQNDNNPLNVSQLCSDNQMFYRTNKTPEVPANQIGEGKTLCTDSCSADSSIVQRDTDSRRCNEQRIQGSTSKVSNINQSAAGSGRSSEFPHSEQILTHHLDGGCESSSFQNEELFNSRKQIAAAAGISYHDAFDHNKIQEGCNHSVAPWSDTNIWRSGSENVLNDDVSVKVSSSDVISVSVPAISDNAISACCQPKQSISETVNLSDFDSKVNLGSNDLKNHNTVGDVADTLRDTFDLEDNSDPNFFRELLGTDEVSHFGDDPVLDPSRIEAWKESANNSCSLVDDSDKHSYDPYSWTPVEIEIASGSTDCTYLEHSLKLRSVYTDVEDYAGTKGPSREPQVTSYNRQFMGTVDYIWSSEGLQTAKVLDTLPKHVLRQTHGFPTKKWGSDHVALACELAFTKASSTK
ncbi:carbon catabolite repressor protein 4 homolog 6 isoform X2 [Curcuma longa]|uniref:carbon catabolite repressor protein 4 homolog 6 isoform X2 n=1 Tax=Curcuma longa TaxID=136217 RepID=UPI003D9ECCB5